MISPILRVASNVKDEPRLNKTTWEQRQGYRDRNGARIEERAGLGMTPAELIKLMGPLHVSDPQFQARPRSLLPMPNLALRQPTLESYKATFWAYLKRACFSWNGYD